MDMDLSQFEGNVDKLSAVGLVDNPVMLALRRLEIAMSLLQEATATLDDRTVLVRRVPSPNTLSPIPLPPPMPPIPAEESRLVRTLRLIAIDIQNQVSRIKSILEELEI